MAYIRKTQPNIVYREEPKGRLERIDNVTWLTTNCAQCNKHFTKKMGLKRFENQDRFYCSTACLNESQRSGIAKIAKEEHFFGKYGVNNPYGSKQIREKINKNIFETYGVKNVSQIPEISQKKSEKMKKLCEETDFIERVTNTMKEKYGCHWLATEMSRDSLKKHAQEFYGVDHHMKSEEFLEHVFKQAFVERHGVDNAMKLPEIVQKVRKTCIEKYGVDNVFKREDVIENRIRKLLNNCKNRSSNEEDKIYQILLENFEPSTVQRHIPIFYRKSNFWIIDFQIENVFIQYDGAYWHGLNKQKKEIQRLSKLGDRTAKMQYKAICRDLFQDSWFKKNNILLFRILGVSGNSSDIWLPKLRTLLNK